ncbi:hypothetical protein [Polaromonas sp. YR568]|uniref:hypothetical protein n=1 Tax=Polaromonas sp. YR568 TaxID=1855301 RepID=UPI00398BF94F
MVDPTTRQPEASGEDLEAERKAIASRRKFVYADGTGPRETWGLALSGGGIRSATFCLGVLQALAKASFNFPKESAPLPKAPEAPNPPWPLLARFDFLSTVSGGGYIGGFYSALFRTRNKQEPVPDELATLAAREAYAALATDPPGRLSKDPESRDKPDRPLRWLRENGRYLAPNNTGDLFYDVAIAIRNLCAVHYVMGVTLLTVFLLMFAFRFGSLQVTVFGIDTLAIALETMMQPQLPMEGLRIWYSPWFGVLGLWLLVAVIPCGVAYWLDQDKSNAEAGKWWQPITVPARVALGLLLVGVALAAFIWCQVAESISDVDELFLNVPVPAFLLVLMDVALFFSLAAFNFAKYRPPQVARLFRNRITRWLSKVLTVSWVIGLLALVETAGQTLYLWLTASGAEAGAIFSVAGVVTALVAAVRKFAPVLAQPGKDGWLSKLPLNAILGVVGVALVLLLAVIWSCVAAALLFGMQMPAPNCGQLLIEAMFTQAGSGPGFSELWPYLYPVILVVFCLFATAAAGWFLGFINLSSLQVMYGARLTRAYLGASNKQRFEGEANMDVTEADESDDFSRKDYYGKNHFGPAHIVNVTINATTGTGDQLTQRDRQGLPLAVTPAGILVDGRRWDSSAGDFVGMQPEANADEAGANGSLKAKVVAKAKALAKALKPPPPELSMGQWMGVSGAAFSTGLGRGTSLGQAMLFTITNIRLGWWWDSGKKDANTPFRLWRNQIYLRDELRARFLGTDGSHWYLSDGGHFENTGVFELLRRKVGFIVCCDCGADPNYTYEDLSNLMRLARIDFRAEFECVGPAAFPGFSADVKDYFATDEAELCPPPDPQGQLPVAPDNKCALLYRVTYAGSKDETFLLVLKPRLIQSAPLDLFEYQVKNPSFPQQTTFDQFFDEAQWESYRKLGVLIGSRIFQ